MRTTTKFMIGAAMALAFASGASSLALAQTGDGRTAESMRRAEMERRAREDARRLASWELRLLELRKTTEQKRDLNLAYAQIREDYRQLQIVNNDLARSLLSGALDFKDVAKSVSEIRRRAARLKENLSLPDPEKPSVRSRSETGAEAEQLKSLLLALDELVIEFVNNPIFEQTKTVNVRMSAKAKADLEEIIVVSDRIKKGSEKLKKAAEKAQ